MKKNKFFFAAQNILLKSRSKNTKKKKSQRINDSKSLYIREDLASELINYINLSLIEGDEFRRNLGISNSKSIRIEREMVAIIMKIFATGIMVRQYKIPGLSTIPTYRVSFLLFCS